MLFLLSVVLFVGLVATLLFKSRPVITAVIGDDALEGVTEEDIRNLAKNLNDSMFAIGVTLGRLMPKEYPVKWVLSGGRFSLGIVNRDNKFVPYYYLIGFEVYEAGADEDVLIAEADEDWKIVFTEDFRTRAKAKAVRRNTLTHRVANAGVDPREEPPEEADWEHVRPQFHTK